ncbi:MAG TPA: hypothetical protein PKD58_08520 [Candidatus Sumerlaeota bacterium]|nr:hypothetical protein [Candidatus Sumerlaeota bacterium]HMZ52077.1 hypothetical protein [Candidatus Sumerlaeota bacterium]HNM46758.1 hypothetical protein [Candidatus Sumerlaeota bacterium]
MFQKINETTEKAKNAAELNVATSEQRPAYESPRIVTHSAQELEKASLKINACTSFLP